MAHSTDMRGSSHYNEKYFIWQRGGGHMSGVLDRWKFEHYAGSAKTILDFGCGGRFILEKLEAKKKYGVEINPFAREEASKRGITVFESIQDIPDELQFDVIISNHALEHVPNPLEVLRDLKKRLKKEGVIVFLLPFNDWRHDRRYNPSDINKHLFTWSPLTIGNLFSVVGYVNIQTEIVRKPWLPYGILLKTYLPDSLFNFLCWIRSILQNIVEIKITASV